MAVEIVVSLTPEQARMLINQLSRKEARIKQSERLPEADKRRRLTELQNKIKFMKSLC